MYFYVHITFFILVYLLNRKFCFTLIYKKGWYLLVFFGLLVLPANKIDFSETCGIKLNLKAHGEKVFIHTIQYQ